MWLLLPSVLPFSSAFSAQKSRFKMGYLSSRSPFISWKDVDDGNKCFAAKNVTFIWSENISLHTLRVLWCEDWRLSVTCIHPGLRDQWFIFDVKYHESEMENTVFCPACIRDWATPRKYTLCLCQLITGPFSWRSSVMSCCTSPLCVSGRRTASFGRAHARGRRVK